MRKHLSAVLITFTLSSLASAVTLAAECGDAPLSAAQAAFLADNAIDINAPEGDLPVILRCDTNGDNWVDINDIRAISLQRNQPIRHPDDPMDWDKNGIINVLDARGCQLACAAPRCALQPADEPPPPQQVGGTTEDAECFQAEDIDGDGQSDQLVAISEIPAEESTRAKGSANLELVIMREVEGEVKYFKEPYAGKSVGDEVTLHLSKQPAGTIDLAPGTVQIDEPGTVSYKNGEPAVLYFWKDGVLFRAPYGVDD